MVSRPLSSLYKVIIGFWFIFMANSAVFATSGSTAATGAEKSTKPFQILALGDSLTAGYGLEPGDGFVDQMQAYLDGQSLNQPVKITNAGVSGDTTSGGQARLAWTLAGFGPKGPDLVTVALGGNDGLRGINPKVTRKNLTVIIKTLTDRKIPVFFIGMQAPPNLGGDYARDFNSIYPDLAKQYQVPLYPFFLDGVAAVKDLNQSDGIHPNKKGVSIIISKMGPVLKKLLDQLQK